jgi:hypothetical protein
MICATLVHVCILQGPLNMLIADDAWVLGWETFARRLQQERDN